MPALDGAMSGLFNLNPNKPGIEVGEPVKIAWLPRANPFGSVTGLEAAIPIGSLFPSGVQPGTQIGLLSYITSTGETGTTLLAHDPLRATLGGRPQPHGYVLNQILPPQPGITSDPGTNPIQLTKYVEYTLPFASDSQNIEILAKPVKKVTIKNTYQTSVMLINKGTSTITGPIFLVIHFKTAGFNVYQATGLDYTSPNSFVVKFPVASLAPSQGLSTKLTIYSLAGYPYVSYSVKNGNGIP